MKKGLILLITVLTLSFITVKADIAAPVINNKDKIIIVEVRDDIEIEKVKESINSQVGVKSSTVADKEKCAECKCDAKATPGESLSEKDIKSLKNATLIIYVTLGILIVLMIIVIALMIARRKKDSKKDA